MNGAGAIPFSAGELSIVPFDWEKFAMMAKLQEQISGTGQPSLVLLP